MTYQHKMIDEDKLEFSRLLKDHEDVYFITGYGNTGDFLIYEGTRRLLKSINISYKEIHISHAKAYKGGLALICGGGAWCKVFNHYMPQFLPVIEKNFQNVMVLPSSFEIAEPFVRNALTSSKALFLCREMESYNQISSICRSKLMHDFALHFDYSDYIKKGIGHLDVFRTDGETTTPSYPDGNKDISDMDLSLQEWLTIISKHDTINTDRAHVMIAAAMMGKTVRYSKTYYHKVPAIAEFSLVGLPVYHLGDP